MNKKLIDKERIILSGVGIAQELWAKSVVTAKYLVNMSPSSVLVDTTPQKVWFGKKPSFSHIKVFGCDAFVHVTKENKNNLENK
jgi:hypothetical protein